MRTEEQSIDNEDEGNSNTRKKRKRKRLCYPSSGRRQGWELKGKKLYNTLCKNVCQLREDQSTGETLENKMMERFQIENGSAGHNAETSLSDDD